MSRQKQFVKSARGRYVGRVGQICHGCGMRLTIGTPKPTDTWPQRITLSREVVNLLLEAAAEYEQLCEDTGTISSAVDFVDWGSVDFLREGNTSPITAEPEVLRTHDYIERRRKGAA